MNCASPTSPSNSVDTIQAGSGRRNRRPAGGAGRPGRAAFTAVELLVAVAIIVILVALVLTIVPRVRLASKRAATQQRINAVAAAIDQYHGDHRAYPGPLTDESVVTGGNLPAGLAAVTMSENLTLGLLGGLRPVVSGGGVTLTYDPARVGLGSVNLSSTTPSPPKSYLEAAASRGMISAGGGPFADAGGRAANDSAVPEFVDTFDDPLPLLYLRARVAAKGIMSDAGTPGGGKLFQYDVRQVRPYTASRIGLTRPEQAHGLQELGNGSNIPDGLDGNGPNTALRYFRQPGTPQASPTTNAGGIPRQKDRYILIGAGPDRVYGTSDDIVSFGSLAP